MMWLIGIVCLAIGVAGGLLLARRFNTTNPSRVDELENRIQELQRFHADYRENVSEHFNTTAELVQQMTDSYRDVYQHLARGAQDLCNDEVASRLLPSAENALFTGNDQENVEQPKDYAPKRSNEHPGALSEGFGLDRKDLE
jgi:uncharacterized protein